MTLLHTLLFMLTGCSLSSQFYIFPDGPQKCTIGTEELFKLECHLSRARAEIEGDFSILFHGSKSSWNFLGKINPIYHILHQTNTVPSGDHHLLPFEAAKLGATHVYLKFQNIFKLVGN